MNLPRRALADIADGRPFFAKVIETGSHPGNLDRIARGEADATAVDNVTYAFWCKYRPEAARQVRILAPTPPAIVDILRAALRTVTSEPCYAAARAGLMIAGIEDVPDAAYEGLLSYEKEAAVLGYPELV